MEGKDVIDGINATDKQYFAGCMCLVGTHEANKNGDKKMAAQSMVEMASKSLADKCVWLCSLDSRLQGMKGYMKHAKREVSAKLKMRHNHVQNLDNKMYKYVGFLAEKTYRRCAHDGMLQYPCRPSSWNWSCCITSNFLCLCTVP
jgi:hypothetical protein